MTIDDAKLRELAEAATPGPWRRCGAIDCSCSLIWAPDGETCITHRDEDCEHQSVSPRDADFIAAANPTTVLALLDAIVVLRTALAIAESDARIGARHLAALVEMTAARDELADIARAETDDKTHGPIGSYGSKIDRIAELRKVGAR